MNKFDKAPIEPREVAVSFEITKVSKGWVIGGTYYLDFWNDDGEVQHMETMLVDDKADLMETISNFIDVLITQDLTLRREEKKARRTY